MPQANIAYYNQRAMTERANALKSEKANVAAIHEELARQYEALVEHSQLRPSLQLVRAEIDPLEARLS